VGGTIEVVSSGRVWVDSDVVAGSYQTLPGQEWRIQSREGEKKVGTVPIEDPLAGVVVEPTLPAFPSSAAIFGGNPTAKTCSDGVSYNSSNNTMTIQPGTYSDSSMSEGGNCFSSKAGGEWGSGTITMNFVAGDYLFLNGAGIYVDRSSRVNINLNAGRYYFSGGGGFVVDGPHAARGLLLRRWRRHVSLHLEQQPAAGVPPGRL
jgi:hypothetical protein